MTIRTVLFISCWLSSSLIAQEEGVAGWTPESAAIDTGWKEVNPIGTCPKTHYPVSIELMPLPGDGVRFRVIFLPRPSEDFESRHTLNLRTEEYRKLDTELKKQGYVQISHQMVTVMIGNVHQAVWIRSANGERDEPEKRNLAPRLKGASS